MNKIVYIDYDEYGREYVREIIPDECRPVEEWYNYEFAKRCVTAPEDVKQNMLYNRENGAFTEWVPYGDAMSGFLKELIETVNKI